MTGMMVCFVEFLGIFAHVCQTYARAFTGVLHLTLRDVIQGSNCAGEVSERSTGYLNLTGSWKLRHRPRIIDQFSYRVPIVGKIAVDLLETPEKSDNLHQQTPKN